MPSEAMAFSHSSPNSWRLFFIILLPMCWFMGILLRWHSEDLATTSLTEETIWTTTANRPASKAGSPQEEEEAENLSSSSLPSSSAMFRWEGYSIKPLAYVFPQFHAIPENDRFWGANFTEWNNVRKVTENRFGLETLRPAPEVGYYNLLDYETRARYARLVKESGCVIPLLFFAVLLLVP